LPSLSTLKFILKQTRIWKLNFHTGSHITDPSKKINIKLNQNLLKYVKPLPEYI
jgi:hypothetical protein